MSDKIARKLFGEIDKNQWDLDRRGSGLRASFFKKQLPDNRPQDGSTSPKSLFEYFDEILDKKGDAETCANSKILDRDAPKATSQLEEILAYISTEYRYCEQLGILYRLFCVCRASQIRWCMAKKCRDYKDELGRLMPSCENWEGFRSWTLQVAACICARGNDARPCQLPRTISFMCSDPKGLKPTEEYEYTITGDDNQEAKGVVSLSKEFKRWQGRIKIFEVVRALTWLEGIATGQYVNMRLPYTMDAEPAGPGLLSEYVEKAKERFRGRLCARRVDAIADCFPSENKEWVLPALIPASIATDLSAQVGHENCAAGYCPHEEANSTGVEQLHVCTEKRCGIKTLDPEVINSAVATNGPCTAWNLEGTRLVDISKEPFMAISHVWADGTGVGLGSPGQVNKCLFDYFTNLSRDYGCEGIWWDTISVPRDTELRKKALRTMHDNYKDARVTLIHDNYLKSCSVHPDKENAALAVALSPWFSRGWSALELAKSKKVLVVFKNGVFDLDIILARRGVPSSLARQVASTAIRTMRQDILTFNDLLTALSCRQTSWKMDMPIIAGLMAGVPVDEVDASAIYQKIVRKFKRIPSQHLFHDHPRMSQVGFHWCPSNLLQMPKALGRPDFLAKLDIKDTGDVVGFWKVVELDEAVRKKIVNNVDESTDTDNLLLLDLYAREALQGIVVKVKDSRILDIYCQRLGLVKFKENLEPYNFGAVKITIGDCTAMKELRQESAVDYVQRVWELRQGKQTAKLKLGPKRVRDGW